MNKDFLKEKISFLKLYITFIVAMIIGSTAWFVDNWDEISTQFIMLTIITVLVLGISFAILTRKAYRLIKEMKNIGEIKNV